MWDKDLSHDNHDRSISKCDQLLPEADNNFQIMIILEITQWTDLIIGLSLMLWNNLHFSLVKHNFNIFRLYFVELQNQGLQLRPKVMKVSFIGNTNNFFRLSPRLSLEYLKTLPFAEKRVETT